MERIVRWTKPRGLLAAALWAVAAAMAARGFGLPGAAAGLAVAALLWTWRGRAGAWLAIVPAALAAAELPVAAPILPRAGPVWIDGEVLPSVLIDEAAGETRLRLRPSGHLDGFYWCAVRGTLRVLPGDRITGPARWPRHNQLESGRPPTAQAHAAALRIERGPPSWTRFAESCRLALQRTMLAAVAGEEGRLLCHLVLGRGPALPPDVVAAHRATGLSHLLAVSGAHASMLGFLLGLLYSTVSGRSPLASRSYRRWCAGFLLLYGGITGMEPPVFRALVAFFAVLFARSRGRRVTVCTALALPALLTAICAPRDLFSASFCLSYAAVAGLALAGVFEATSWRQRFVVTPLIGSCWATLATMPFTLYYFGQVAPWTILATPLLAPLVAMMLASGLLVSVVGLHAPGAAAVLGLPLEAMTALYLDAVRGTATLPFAPILATCVPEPALLVGCGFAGAALCCWRPGRLAVAGLCLCLSLPYFTSPPTASPRLELLAVGHGQACLAILPDGAAVLVDCGSLLSERRAALAATRALRPLRRLDLLVLTHGDHDHTGAVLELMQRVDVARVALPNEIANSDLARRLAERGAEVITVLPGTRFEARPGVQLCRPVVASPNRNDHSLWVHLALGPVTALVPGDPLEAGVEAWLAQAPQRATLLVLPHHGRPHARLPELLAVVQPELALVSNHSDGGWTSQSKAARALGVRVLETGRVGTIRVHIGEEVRVATERALGL